MSVDFEPMLARSSSFMEHPMESPFLMDNIESAMDYLQYPPSPSPPFGSSLNASASSGGEYDGVNLSHPMGGDYTYTASPFSNSSPQPYMGEDLGISPRAMTYAGDEDRTLSGRRSRASNDSPPPSIPYAATVPRSHRHDPIGAATRRNSTARKVQKARKRKASDESDDDDDEYQVSPSAGGPMDNRRESVRQQRIESEQKRRDELRRNYDLLRDVLPPTQQRTSKVHLLSRASEYIRELETTQSESRSRLQAFETEVKRLREINDALMMGTARALGKSTLGISPHMTMSNF
ncbi:uncharacterized protein EV420DRAFT_1514650 [Desarmillaria tabescens]|uniref:BHLH domain-containing protein n=1 Tax=Armillaria tabescens TaxID=1929756 RepID=A0AA39T585_ARMTA|nr:uncharacterized protein EV420DRAFT_1514650 [Desarmillaria tabescens]KAK0465506.1 hypothetical protein EV420DRAFT_1514650 [Desarmillaria tabescens]